mgnify:CR=1 FL=1
MASANSQQFGKVPTGVVLAGRLAGQTRSGLAVYLVLAATGQGWVASPSVATIAAATGCSRRTVQLALRALESSGLIRATGRPGGGAISYEITTSEAQLGAPRCATGGPTMRTPDCAHTERTERTEPAGAAAGLISLLEGAGIGEPTRGKLADDLARRGVTRGDVATTISDTKATGGGPGLIVARLRDLSQARASATAEASTRSEGRQRDQEYRRRVDEERRSRDAVLAGYSDAELGAVASTVAAACPLFTGRNWRTNQGFRSAMVRHLATATRQAATA